MSEAIQLALVYYTPSMGCAWRCAAAWAATCGAECRKGAELKYLVGFGRPRACGWGGGPANIAAKERFMTSPSLRRCFVEGRARRETHAGVFGVEREAGAAFVPQSCAAVVARATNRNHLLWKNVARNHFPKGHRAHAFELKPLVGPASLSLIHI